MCASHDDAWNCVAAYLSPESDSRKLKKSLAKLKLDGGKKYNDEIKLNDIYEEIYFDFLKSLSKTKGVLLCVATDCSLISEKDINEHKEEQAKRVIENRDKMLYEAGREMVQALHDKLTGVSPQLYLQLFCQLILICDVIEKGILYFVQSHPRNLRKFSWHIDQKNTAKIDYEEAFEKITPGLLQTRSLREPFVTVKEFDYTAMDKYFYTKETEPTYLEEHYGIKRSSSEGSLNIGKLLWDDLDFCDSKSSFGVQISDLLASGVRRLLRNGFADNSKAAELLGGLMINPLKNGYPLSLISFVDALVENKATVASIEILKNNANSVLQS